MNIKDIFAAPQIYQWFQQAGGFFGARIKSIDNHLPIRPGDRILDIGCGPGFIVEHLPLDTTYIGFDTDEKYIHYATKRFGSRAKFVHGLFDEAAAELHGPADIIMMNGVLHHLSDEEARSTLSTIAGALTETGRLFTLDGCYIDNQSKFIRYLLRNDRGQYVRTEQGYKDLLKGLFPTTEVQIYSTLSWVPYTYIIMVSSSQTEE